MAREKQKVVVKLDVVGQRSITQIANVNNPLQKILAASIFSDFALDPGGGDTAEPVDNTEYYDETGFSEETTPEEQEAIMDPVYEELPGGEYVLVPPEYDGEGAYIPANYVYPTVPPSIILISITEPRAVTLEWNSVQNATKYGIYWASGAMDTYNLKDVSLTTTKRIEGLYPGSTYYFKITAKNDYGQSPLSNYIEVKTLAETQNGNGDNGEEYIEPPKTYVNHYIQIDDNEPHFIQQTTGNDPTIIQTIQLTVYRGLRTIKYYNDDSYPWKVNILIDDKRTSISRKNTAEVKVYIGKRLHVPIAQPVKRFSTRTKTRATPLSGFGFNIRKKKK
jgi:hypothetical protein